MDLTQVINAVVSAVKAVIESGIIEKILGTLEKAAPYVVNIIDNIVEIISK